MPTPPPLSIFTSRPSSAQPLRPSRSTVQPLARSSQASSSIFHAGSNRSQAVSSIGRLGQQNSTHVTSVARQQGATRSVLGKTQEQGYGDVADDSRYAYVRRLIKARKQKEAAELASELSKSGNGALLPHTGSQYSEKKDTKQITKLFRRERMKYSSFTKDQRKFAVDLIKKYAKKSTTGHTGFSRMTTKAMRQDIDRARKQGVLHTNYQAKTLKRLTDSMKRN